VLIIFDECLLAICKSCSSTQKMIDWRQRLCSKPFELKVQYPSTLKTFSRSMQYIRELQARQVFRSVLSKAAGHILPPELLDMVFGSLLAERGIASVGCEEEAWKPLDITLLNDAREGNSGNLWGCCTGAGEHSARRPYRHEMLHSCLRDVLRWSKLQHRYVRYHSDQSDYRIANALMQSACGPRDRLAKDQVFYRICRNRPWEPMNRDMKFCAAPFPFGQGRIVFQVSSECEWADEVFEVDDETSSQVSSEDEDKQ
jgi:hypothetical protein